MYKTLVFLLIFYFDIAKLDDDDVDKVWNEWKRTFNKSYGLTSSINHLNIYPSRQNWLINYMKIKEHNQEAVNGNHTFLLGLNEYSDLSFEQFSLMKLGFKGSLLNLTSRSLQTQNKPELSSTNLPTSFDWRNNGAVTAVRDQGACGSCWAWSAIGAIESQVFRITNTLVELSPQQLVDCDATNSGCYGGLMMPAFYYMKKYGIMEEKAYPYTGRDQSCTYEKEKIAVKVSEFYDISTTDELTLMRALSTIGPLSIGVMVTSNFMSYKSGIFSDPLCNRSSFGLTMEDLNHAVLLVGFGETDTGLKYWIIRNQWGTRWGDNGYIYMTRDRRFNCGIGLYVSYAKVTNETSFGHSARNSVNEYNSSFYISFFFLSIFFIM